MFGKGKVNGKVYPRTGHEGPEGVRTHSSTFPSTSTLDGVGGQRHGTGALPPGKTHYPLCRKLERAPGPVWKGAENLSILAPRICAPLQQTQYL
jgi:hypothetical protein